MRSFDVYFESVDGRILESDFLVSVLRSLPHIRGVQVDDPSCFIYRNDDTAVHFTIVVDRAVVPERDEEDVPAGRNRGSVSVLPDADEMAEAAEEEEDEYEEDEYEDEEEDEDDDDGWPWPHGREAAVHLPPLTISVPLFRPSFFISELMQVIEALLRTGDFVLVDPHTDAGEDRALHECRETDVLDSWKRHHAEMFKYLKNPQRIQRWTSEQSHRFYSYGRLRPALAERFHHEGIDVPRVQPALHDGSVKSLSIWNIERSTVLPRSDLILLEETREKKGLFGRKKVIDSRLVESGPVWDLLGAFAEIHTDPAPYLVFRRPDRVPAQVAAGLERLQSEPGARARRTELAGVIDFEIPSDVESPGTS